MLRVADFFKDSDTGRQRRANEDSVYARAPLFVVADGMGGASSGEVASRMAVETLERGLPDGSGPAQDRLAARVEEANEAIHDASRMDAEHAGMGTTLTAAYIDAEEAAIAHVGDSRAYLLRDGELRQLTRDHSLVDEFVRQGKLTEEEARDHPQKSIITRALGPEPAVEVDRQTLPLRDGDVLLLCSDGLTSMVHEDEIAPILASAGSLQEAGKRLIAAANEAGGRDNITVILLRIEEVATGAGALEQQATTVGEAAPRVEDVRAAVATAERERRPTTETVVPRQPRPRTAPAGERRRRPLPAWVKGLIVSLVLLVPIVVGLWVASQSVYFVGTDGRGFVTMYRGVPYELPAGIDLYSRNYVSGVPITTVPAARRKALLDHKLRSHDDARDLVRQLELGTLNR
jgi:serine/threonine protein phosphatase PrpC